ncbi:MAG TPA: hypothetical protein VK509_00700 [Polyangiales bacterium]|nr:hypothetical protein [Polyangiales bacterium]
MLPSAVSRRRLRWRLRSARWRLRRAPRWLRWLALGALAFGTPVIQQALTETVVLLADDCDCGDDCKDHGECPGPCQTCFCCPHSNVLSVAGVGMLVRSGLRERLRFEQDARHFEGYLSSPFRPPIG